MSLELLIIIIITRNEIANVDRGKLEKGTGTSTMLLTSNSSMIMMMMMMKMMFWHSHFPPAFLLLCVLSAKFLRIFRSNFDADGDFYKLNLFI